MTSVSSHQAINKARLKIAQEFSHEYAHNKLRGMPFTDKNGQERKEINLLCFLENEPARLPFIRASALELNNFVLASSFHGKLQYICLVSVHQEDADIEALELIDNLTIGEWMREMDASETLVLYALSGYKMMLQKVT